MKRMLLIVAVLCGMTATAGNKTNALKRLPQLIAAKTHRFNARRLAQKRCDEEMTAFNLVQENGSYGSQKKAIEDEFAAKLLALRNQCFNDHDAATKAKLDAALTEIGKEYNAAKTALKAKYPKTVKVVPVDESVATDLDEVAAATTTAI